MPRMSTTLPSAGTRTAGAGMVRMAAGSCLSCTKGIGHDQCTARVHVSLMQSRDPRGSYHHVCFDLGWLFPETAQDGLRLWLMMVVRSSTCHRPACAFWTGNRSRSFLEMFAAVVSAVVDKLSVLDDSTRARLPSSAAPNSSRSPQPHMSPDSSSRLFRDTRKQIEVRGSFRSEVRSNPPR